MKRGIDKYPQCSPISKEKNITARRPNRNWYEIAKTPLRFSEIMLAKSMHIDALNCNQS